jgi:hypothetical protein
VIIVLPSLRWTEVEKTGNIPAPSEGAAFQSEDQEMRILKTLACAAVVGGLGFAAAEADAAVLNHTFVEREISSAATTADPTLANYRTWDLLIETSSDWTNSEILVTLDSGSFYQAALGGDIPSNPAFWAFPGFQNLEYDTFFTRPPAPSEWTAPSFAGRHPSEGQGGRIVTTDKLSVAWFDEVNEGPGTFVLARFTVSNDANASSILLRSFTAEFAGEAGVHDNSWMIVNGAFIPEPSALGLLGLAGIALIRRRRAA